MKKYLLIAAAFALFAGCKKTGLPAGVGEGSIEFQPAVSMQIESRATTNLPDGYTPDVNDFSLLVKSKTEVTIDDVTQIYSAEYPKFSGYNAPLVPAADYRATISYGDTEAEGSTAYCYEGSLDYTIVARKTLSGTIKAHLVNSAVGLSCGEWFNGYYKDAEFVLRTESDNGFDFDATTTGLIFVKPDTKLYLSGKATKIRNNEKIEFDEYELTTTAAGTWHKIVVELLEVGKGSIGIHLNEDSHGEGQLIPVYIELNPEA